MSATCDVCTAACPERGNGQINLCGECAYERMAAMADSLSDILHARETKLLPEHRLEAEELLFGTVLPPDHHRRPGDVSLEREPNGSQTERSGPDALRELGARVVVILNAKELSARFDAPDKISAVRNEAERLGLVRP